MNRYGLFNTAAAVSILLIQGAVWAADRPASPESRPGTGPGAAATVLRMARSHDGLAFTDTGHVFLRGAGAADVERLPNGALLAVFDRAEEKPDSDKTVLTVSRSDDEGRTWSRPREIRLEGGPRDAQGHCGDLVTMPNGTVRLYFVIPPNRAGAGGSMASAVTRNGLEYRIDPAARFPVNGYTIPVAVMVGSQVHLYATDAREQTRGRLFTSEDGRRFKPRGSIRAPGVRFVGTVVSGGKEKELRAYVSGDGGVRSAVSTDGVAWRTEPGVRVAKGWDPAVARLKDGTYLMLYCAAADTVRKDEPQVALGGVSGPSSDGGSWESFGPENDPVASQESAESDSTDAAEDSPVPLPPKPDFKTHVDYMGWLHEQFPDEIGDNAFDAYAAFMPGHGNPAGDPPDWPKTINDMFNSDYSGPICPWNPADHPEWEATHEALAGLLSQFREATRHEQYGQPMLLSRDGQPPATTPDGYQLVMGMMFPSLGRHRDMVKATLADTWRTEDGRVPPERMRDGWETCLRNANHMHQGPTLINHLVGIAEQALVEQNARKALQHGVFSSAEELESAMDTLARYDGSDDPPRWIAAECAVSMDATQYLFTGNAEDQEPTVNAERIETLGRAMGDFGSGQETVNRLSQLTAEDAQRSVDTFDTFYRELGRTWSTGYPAVRAAFGAAGVDGLAEQYVGTTPITQEFIPALGRAYHLTARNEASRRATRLSYAVHLFKARNGRWPGSLDELPPEHQGTLRTDPFSGGDFGYRVSENGPTIWSASENGRDDGGVHSPHWANENEGESDDYVFWPPQER